MSRFRERERGRMPVDARIIRVGSGLDNKPAEQVKMTGVNDGRGICVLVPSIKEADLDLYIRSRTIFLSRASY